VPEIAELERSLDLLREGIDWPATPALAGRITARIATPAPAPRAWFQSRWAIAAAVVLLAIAALIAYTPSRDAIASWINLHTTITRVNQLPTPSPLPSGPLGKRLGLGEPTTLAAAQGEVAWKVLVPASLGRPDEVYFQVDAPAGEVNLVYKSRPGLKTSRETGVAVLITEVSGRVDTNFFGKMLGQGTTIEDVTVNGHQGWWISGEPHEVFFADANGNFRSETLRLATNTLLIDEGGIIARIEGDLTKAQALEIAASLS
jgi:hypothetical protein